MPSLHDLSQGAGGSFSLRQLAIDGNLPFPLSLRKLLKARGERPGAEIPFRYGTHNLTFGNFRDGVPDLGTFSDTFGATEVAHEQLDPIFGHPVLTAAFYGLYHYYLKGKDRGGLATGFCTSLASMVADNFWTGRTDTPTITKASVHKSLTTIHGKLLSRQSLIRFHEQGREGVARVERTGREIEATFVRGCGRHSAPLIFFIPAGAAWDDQYFDKLGSSHCVMPYRFAYPAGHPGPRLSPDGRTTVTDLRNVELYVWDCNRPSSPNCRLIFRDSGGQLGFGYFRDSEDQPILSSQTGVTLGMMTNGDYLLTDHDLPYGGPYGLKRFIVDFLLSPADLQVTDQNGKGTGNFGGQIRADIPGSHPCYLVPGAYLLPTGAALSRRIIGTGAGEYTFNSILPDGGSIEVQGVRTAAGQVDLLSVNADQTQLRFTPAAEQTFNLTIARRVGDQTRAIALRGAGGGPAAAVEIITSPDLTSARLGNRGAARQVEMRALMIDQAQRKTLNKQLAAVDVPATSDLHVDVPDWNIAEARVRTLPISSRNE